VGRPDTFTVLAALAAVTDRLGLTQIGHRTALSVVEEFGLIDALHPGRLDLGLGRSGGRPSERNREPTLVGATQVVDGRAPNGLRIPPRFSFEHLLGSPRFELQKTLLRQPGAEAQDYGGQVDDIVALLRGSYRSADGVEAHAIPGEGADVQVTLTGHWSPTGWTRSSSAPRSRSPASSNNCRRRPVPTS
jgi:Luciferase-like monooxygenase